MSKKTARLLALILTLALTMALCFAFAACNKTGDGGGEDVINPDGGDGKNTGDVSDLIKLRIVPSIYNVDFVVHNEEVYLPEKTVYYAPVMENYLNFGRFELSVKLNYDISYEGTAFQGSERFTLSEDGLDKDIQVLDYQMRKVVKTDGVFVELKGFYSSKLSTSIYRHLQKLGISDQDAKKFLGDRSAGSSDGDTKIEVTMDTHLYDLDFCQFMSGFDKNTGAAALKIENIKVIDSVEDGGSLDIEIEDIIRSDSLPEEYWRNFFVPYSTIETSFFETIGNSASDRIKSDLSRNVFMKGIMEERGAGRISISLDNADFASDCEFDRNRIVLNRNEITYSAVVGYKKYTFTAHLGRYFAERYSELTVEAQKVAETIDFEGTHANDCKTTVKIFGQTAEVPVRKEYAGYVCNSTDLPLFFADKLRTTLRYEVDGISMSYIPYGIAAPDTVTMTVDDCDAGQFSLSKMHLNVGYNGKYQTSIDAISLLTSEDYSLNEVQRALLNLAYGDGTKLINYYPGSDYGEFDKSNLTAASDTPYVYNNVYIWLGGKSFNLNFSIKINRTVSSISVDGTLPDEYWQYENIDFGSAKNFVVKYNDGVYSNHYSTENIAISSPSDFASFDTQNVTERKEYMAKIGEKTYGLSSYYRVKKNSAIAMELSENALNGLFVKGETFEFAPFEATVSFESGLKKKMTFTKDAVSGYDENLAGTQTLTVTFENATATKDIIVKEVSRIKFYEAISDTYMLNELPTEVLIEVTFTDSDYDVIELSEQQIGKMFDTETAGNRNATFTFGGKSVSMQYKVVEAAYLYYNVDETTMEADILGMGYQKTDRAYLLSGCSEIVIPSTIGEYAVTCVDTEAFKGLNGIRSVIVPESVTDISGNAFKSCSGLKSLIIKGNPTVGNSILDGCTNLKYLEIPASAKESLSKWFTKADSKIAVPAGLTVKFSEGSEVIPDNFFQKLSDDAAIEKLILPQSLTSIGKQEYGFDKILAFEAIEGGSFSVLDGVLYCDEGTTLCYYPVGLKNETLVIGENVVTVGGIFKNAYLKKVVIGKNVTTLGESIFANCSALCEVVFNGSIKKIPDYAFQNCEALTSFTFPQGVEYIGKYAFDSTKLSDIIIPDSVTSIGFNAFYFIPAKRIYIPAHLTEFFGPDSGSSLNWGYYKCLETLTYSGSIPLDKLTLGIDNYTPLKEVYLTVTVCDNWAKKINWPAKVYALEAVTSVGNNAGTLGTYTLLSERSSGITNNCSNVKITYNQTFTYWWK